MAARPRGTIHSTLNVASFVADLDKNAVAGSPMRGVD